MTALMAEPDTRHWPTADERFEALLLKLLRARTPMERILAVGPLLDAGFGTEWLIDDACDGRSVQVKRFAGHVIRTETSHQQRTLAESGLAVPLHTAERVRVITSQEMASRNWWSQLDMTEGAS